MTSLSATRPGGDPWWQPVVLATGLFRAAPHAALPLWAAGIATQLVLSHGASRQLPALVWGEVGTEGLIPVALSSLLGWAADCVLQATWARLAWQALQRRPCHLTALWRGLGGAWTSVGVLVAYAALSAVALAWPRPLRALEALGHPSAWAVGVAAVTLVLAWVGLRICLAVPAAAAHQLGTAGAWKMSWRRTKGRLPAVCVLLALGPALGWAASAVADALLPDLPGKVFLVTAIQASCAGAFAGVPGAMLWAWSRGEDKL